MITKFGFFVRVSTAPQPSPNPPKPPPPSETIIAKRKILMNSKCSQIYHRLLTHFHQLYNNHKLYQFFIREQSCPTPLAPAAASPGSPCTKTTPNGRNPQAPSTAPRAAWSQPPPPTGAGRPVRKRAGRGRGQCCPGRWPRWHT